MRRLRFRPAAVALACALALAGGGARRARGGDCRSRASPPRARGRAGECPYSSASIIGMRAEGVLRFPEAVAVDAFGNVYVADQLSLRRAEVLRRRAYLGQWGSYGGGHGQFGPIGGLATDAAGNVYVVDSEHNRIEKFSPSGEFIKDWGHFGSELGQFNFGSSQNPTQPPGGGIAVYGSYVYVADSRQRPHRALQPRRRRSDRMGLLRDRPRPVLLPARRRRQRDRGARHRRRQPPHREIHPDGQFEGADGSEGASRRPVRLPLRRSRSTPPATSTSPTTSTTASSSSIPQLGYVTEWGGFGSKPGQLAFPRGARQRPRRRHLRRRHRQRSHPGVRPRRPLPAHDRRLRARARPA